MKKIIIGCSIILLAILSVSLWDRTKMSSADTGEVREVKTMYNVMVFARFSGEEEFIGDKKLEEYSRREIIDNTYNTSSYSMQEYYKSVSNQKLNLKTVYLFADDDFSSFELKHTRGYYSPKSDKNPEGYDGTGISSGRWYEWLDDWGSAVQSAICDGRRPEMWDGNGNKVSLEDLDYDKDGYIDSISLIYSKADENSPYSSSQQDVLWAYQGITGKISIDTGERTLTSHRFSQSTLQFEKQGLYRDRATDGKAFLSPASTIHETGHVFGFQDLYYYKDTAYTHKPVYYMSPMAKPMSPVTQFMTCYERNVQGWLDDTNVGKITKDGLYKLKPLFDKEQQGIISYKIKVPNDNNTWIYMEYRYSENEEINRFNADSDHLKIYDYNGDNVAKKMIRPSKSGLLVYVVNTRSKYPSNAYCDYGIWDMDVLGGEKSTRSDAPRAAGEGITYGDISIDVSECSEEGIEFCVKGIKEETELGGTTEADKNQDIALYNDIPQIQITVDSTDDINRKSYISAQVKITDSETNTETVEDNQARIKIRGNSTAYLDKLPYNIKFSSKQNVLAMGEGKKWCLLANRMDKTLMRNKLAYDFAKKLNLEYAVSSRYADVWLNGVYQGNYLITTPVETGIGRLPLNTSENEFLLEVESSRDEEGVTYVTTPIYGIRFALNDPEKLTENQKEYIEDFLSKTETAIESGSAENIIKYVDIKSVTDMYILQELFKNLDANDSSTRFYIKNNKLYAGPIWDFDMSAGGESTYLYGEKVTSPEGFYVSNNGLLNKLMKQEQFKNYFELRYKELQPEINKIFSQSANEVSQIDVILNKYKNALLRDSGVAGWKIEKTSYMERTPEATYEENVEFLREWLSQRNVWLYNNLNCASVQKQYSCKVIESEYLCNEATCTEAASYYYSTIDGERGSMTFESGTSLSHDFGDWKVVREATKDMPGLEERICSRCNKVETREIEYIDDGEDPTPNPDSDLKDDSTSNPDSDLKDEPKPNPDSDLKDDSTSNPDSDLKDDPAKKPSPTKPLSSTKAPALSKNIKYKGNDYTIFNTKKRYVTLKKVNKKSVSLKVADYVKTVVNKKKVSYKVTEIKKNAAKNNKKIKSVVIGKNVTKIGKNSFCNCRKLKKIKINSKKLKKIEGKAFKGVNKKCKVYLPKKQYKKYKKMLIKAGIFKSVKFIKI